ncbi:RDD family protein [Propionibacteriaceae bacterium Y1923]
MTSQTLPPPGWYDDPGGSSQERYWEGTRWTKNLRDRLDPLPEPAPAATTGRAAPASSPAPQLQQQFGAPPQQSGATGMAPAPMPTRYKMVRTTADGVPLAGFGMRALATLVDWVLMGLLGMLLAWPWTVRVWRSLQQMTAWSLENPGLVVPVQDYDYLTPFSIVQYVTLGACFVAQVLLVKLLGGTVGQLMLGLRVVPSEKGLTPRVSWRTSLLRSGVWLAVMAATQMVLFPMMISYLRPLWHPRLKTWHDSLADTQVITTRGTFAESVLAGARRAQK